MCGTEGKPVLRHGAGHASAIDNGFGSDPGHGAEHVSDQAAGHRNQDRLGAGTSPLSAAEATFTQTAPLHRYAAKRSRAGLEPWCQLREARLITAHGAAVVSPARICASTL